MTVAGEATVYLIKESRGVGDDCGGGGKGGSGVFYTHTEREKVSLVLVSIGGLEKKTYTSKPSFDQ